MSKTRKINRLVENGGFDDFKEAVIDRTRGSTSSVSRWVYTQPLISNKEVQLLNFWNKKGLVRTYVELPVDDALKGGIKITADNLDDRSIKILQDEFKKHIPALKEAAYWARLFGGSALITLNNGLSTEEPFVKENKKNKDIEFLAVDRWRIGGKQGYDKKDIDGILSANAMVYSQDSLLSVNSKLINNSRVQIMRGDNAPIITRQRVNGWGLSILEKVSDNIDSYEQANELVFELLKEGKTNVVKVKGLIDSLSAGKFDHIIKWVQKAQTLKESINTLVMDSQDDFLQTQSNVSGYSDLLKTIKQGISADFRIPMTKLFGLSAAGFNSGEDDIDNYNSMIESDIRPEIRPTAQYMLEVLSYSVLGVDAKGLTFDFMPLKELSQVAQSIVDKEKFERFMALWNAGMISDLELSQKLEKEKLI